MLNSYSRIYLHPSPSPPSHAHVGRALVDFELTCSPAAGIQCLREPGVHELVDLDGMDGGVQGLEGVRDP